MRRWQIVAWTATALGLLGAGLVAFRRPVAGQIVWCVSNPLMIAWGVKEGVPQRVCLFVAFTVLAAVGVWNGIAG